MKFNKESTYFQVTAHVVLGALVILAFIGVLLHLPTIWGSIWYYIGEALRILKPLIIGLILAYLLDPLVVFFTRQVPPKKNPTKRILATFITYIVLLLAGTLLVWITMLNIRKVMGTNQLEGFMAQISSYMDYVNQMLENVTALAERFHLSEVAYTTVENLYSKVFILVQYFTSNVANILTNIGANLLNIGLGVVISFYLLIDKITLLSIWRKILDKICTKKIGTEARSIGHDMDKVFSGYIRGTLIDATIVAILISGGLMLIGLDFAVLIGVIAGIFNIIPYFGPIVGTVLAGLIGVIGPEPQKGIYAMVLILIIQQIDGWYIVPKVVGESVKLHPIVVLLSILIGGSLFGFVGILLGVPVAAFIRLLIIRYCGDIFEP